MLSSSADYRRRRVRVLVRDAARAGWRRPAPSARLGGELGVLLGIDDEGNHVPGDQINWNESRYVDFWDPVRRTGGWFRIGARPNAHYAEMSACVYLPDGRVGFAFDRADIDSDALGAAGAC